MCNHLSNLLPFKALSTSFLQRGTSFQPPKNSCPYLECFQGTFSHPWQQWQKKSHGDNHNNTFKNRMHQTCSLKKRISTCQTYTKFKAENSQKFGITAQIHLVPSLTPSAQTGSFLHLLSTCSLAMLLEPGATHPWQWQAAHQRHLTPGKGTASDPAELQTMGEQIANSKSREAPCLFSSCVVQAKLSVTGSFGIKTTSPFKNPDPESS